MSLRVKFIIFALAVHSAFIVLSIFLYTDNVVLFFVAEAVILISISVTLYFYRAFTRPLDLIAAGVESIRDQDFSTKFTPVGGGEIGRLVDTYNKMIDQLRNERVKRQEQHYFLERLVNASPIGIIILDLDGNIAAVNRAGQEMLGVGQENPVGRPLNNFHDLVGAALMELKAGETTIINVSGIQVYKCSKFHFLDRGFPRYFIMIEELTREIMAAQKKAYDKVIRMMSHEINNSVGAVNSILNSSLNYRNQLTPEDASDFEGALQVAIDRNNRLNRFMSNFADVVRIPPPVREPYDLHRLLRSVQVLMSGECERRRVAWSWELAPAPFIVDIDIQQMEQVLVNVVKNALEAIGSDGTITMRTLNEGAKSLTVIDTGKGVSPEERLQVFAPFFSTKKDGQGIGLTLTREVLINHGFGFHLESTGKGHTEFQIEFR
jgi:two-component system nitrogen regulation sensor histidine kinase NtrY